MALVSKDFYFAMNIKFRSLCISNNYILYSETQISMPFKQNFENNLKIFYKKSMQEKIIDSKNYIQIYGYFFNK